MRDEWSAHGGTGLFGGGFNKFLIVEEVFNILRIAFADEDVVIKDMGMGEQETKFAKRERPIGVIVFAFHSRFDIAVEIFSKILGIGGGNMGAVERGEVETPTLFKSIFDEVKRRI